MGISLGVTLFDPIKIDVCLLTSETEYLFNILLGINENLDISFFDAKTRASIYQIELNLPCLGGYIDNKWTKCGNNFTYTFNEYWECYGDKKRYDFYLGKLCKSQNLITQDLPMALMKREF